MTNAEKTLAVLILAAGLVSGCGYKFAGAGNLPGGIRRVCIPPVENRTAEPGLETVLTGDLIDEFIGNGKTVAATPEEADGVLTGRVEFLKIRTISREGDHSALERRVEISLALKFKDRNGRILWSGDKITESEAYLTASDKLATEHNRREAVSAISERLAERVYNYMSR